MQSKAATVEKYLGELPEDRRRALQAVRAVILKNLDRQFEECMSYGMIGYVVPHSVFPPGYHCNPAQPLPFAGLASQKNYMSIYLMACYGNDAQEKWLREAWARAGKKLDMGKCCIRFRKLEDLPLEVVGEAIRRVRADEYIRHYEAALTSNRRAAATRAAQKSASSRRPVKPKATSAKKPTANGRRAGKAAISMRRKR
ncbi:hypothetical protein RAS1_23610 [Phycisphaerae bacterium RAS1]|nr:hypothetical protein RAS1_23610 [Phycisphaerae bacterium RAS1]